MEYPIREVDLVLRACNPAEPLPSGDERWFDFGPLRHQQVLSRLLRVFVAPPERNFHHRLLCGHRGSGKSTELLRFKERAEKKGFAVERIEVDIRFGIVELELVDFFLLAAQAAEQAVEARGGKLDSALLKKVIRWFADVTTERTTERRSELSIEAEAQLGGKLPLGLGKLVAKFASAIKAGSSSAVTARQHLRNFPDQLIDLTNEVLKEADRELAKGKAARGLILLFDNLDRYPPVNIDSVVVQGSTLLRRLGCHALFIVPIDLEYNPLSGPLRDAYGQPIVLPMVPLRKPGETWKATVKETPHDSAAIAGVVEALGRRLDAEVLFETPADVRSLVRMSGGCIRDLMHLVALTYEMSIGDLLTRTGVERAISELRATYIRELDGDDFERLAVIASHKSIPRDQHTHRLLFNRWALEYYDESGKVWIDVHPLVIEIEELQRAYRKHSGATARKKRR